MEKSDLLKLLELEMKEEQYYLAVFQKEVTFFWGSISAIVVATLVGLYKSTVWEHYLYLLVAPVMIFVLAAFMKYSLFRTYRRFIEVIATRAKVEAVLGLNELTVPDDSPYWGGETLIAKRHAAHRSDHHTSEAFVEFASKRGLYSIYKNVVVALQIISVAILLSLVAAAYTNYHVI